MKLVLKRRTLKAKKVVHNLLHLNTLLSLVTTGFAKQNQIKTLNFNLDY